MSDINIKESIETYIKYIRRMSLLNDDQLKIIVNKMCIQSHTIDIEKHILRIRQMSIYTDDQLRQYLTKAADDPVISEIFKDHARRKVLQDINSIAKDIQSDPRKFARKIDDF